MNEIGLAYARFEKRFPVEELASGSVTQTSVTSINLPSCCYGYFGLIDANRTTSACENRAGKNLKKGDRMIV